VVTRKKPSPGEPAGPPANAADVHDRLATALPQPRCELDHRDAWTLLVATILSAQSTDRTVNTVTPVLFEKWPTPEALATAPREEVEAVVHRTGFFRNKAKAIQGASLVIHTQHGGEVPRDMAQLVALPGVARKTANVVLGVAFRIAAGIVVDTHVMRVSQRLGWTTATLADKVEQDLCTRFPREQWIDTGHRLLLHGRYVCLAKGPKCEDCPLNELCPSREAPPLGTWQERAAHMADAVAAGTAVTPPSPPPAPPPPPPGA
jgi:endonuclease-3